MFTLHINPTDINNSFIEFGNYSESFIKNGTNINWIAQKTNQGFWGGSVYTVRIGESNNPNITANVALQKIATLARTFANFGYSSENLNHFAYITTQSPELWIPKCKKN